MPATEAQIAANQKNALLSSGPRTEAGKAQSRRNALKHGLTAGVILPQAEAAEVERKFQLMRRDMEPSTELAIELVRQIALLSVRLRRCEIREVARQTERINQAMADFDPPEGATPEDIAELRAEVADLALFDPSPEAERERRYEAAARRGFFKAIQELRQEERKPAPVSATEQALQALQAMKALGSFRPGPSLEKLMEPMPGETIRKSPLPASKPGPIDQNPSVEGVSYVPIAVGKPR
jgi:hypothetical protein